MNKNNLLMLTTVVFVLGVTTPASGHDSLDCRGEDADPFITINHVYVYTDGSTYEVWIEENNYDGLQREEIEHEQWGRNHVCLYPDYQLI